MPPRRAHTCPSPALSCTTPGTMRVQVGSSTSPRRPGTMPLSLLPQPHSSEIPSCTRMATVAAISGRGSASASTAVRGGNVRAAGRASSDAALAPQQWIPLGLTAQKAALPPASRLTSARAAPSSRTTRSAPSGPRPRSPQQRTTPLPSSAQAAWIPRQPHGPPGQLDEQRRRHDWQPGPMKGPWPQQETLPSRWSAQVWTEPASPPARSTPARFTATGGSPAGGTGPSSARRCRW